jgi:predicted RNase H-like HicB family nuclease
MTRKSLKYYLGLKYSVLLVPDKDGYFAKIPSLPGCMTQGDSIDETLKNLDEVRVLWLETAYEHKDPIPLPSQEDRESTVSERKTPVGEMEYEWTSQRTRKCDHCPTTVSLALVDWVLCQKCGALVCSPTKECKRLYCSVPRATEGLCKRRLEHNSDVDTIIDGSIAHGEFVNDVAFEGSDLADVLKDAWELLTPGQRKDLLVQDSVRTTLSWLLKEDEETNEP